MDRDFFFEDEDLLFDDLLFEGDFPFEDLRFEGEGAAFEGAVPPKGWTLMLTAEATAIVS